MKVDIPDQFIVRILGFAPDTPPKEAVQKFMSDRTIDRRLISYSFGEYVLHEMTKSD